MVQLRIYIPFYLLFSFSILAVQAQNPKISLSELKSRAKAGEAKSQYQLGYVYEKGMQGEKVNLKKAISFYEKSSQQKYDSALFALGNLYESGKGVEKNEQIAFTYYKSAIERKHSDALFKLGYFHENGIATKKNQREAVKYYLLAFENGNKEALTKLAKLDVDLYANKTSTAYLKYEKTQRQSSKGVSSKSSAESDFKLGQKYETGRGVRRDYKKAFEYYKSSADKGYSKAQVATALMYSKGKGVTRNKRLAVKYLMLASEQGDRLAKLELRKYDLKKYIDTNSIEYLQHKADSGDPESQYKLYFRYLHGTDVEQSMAKALEYCQKAAIQDYEPAIMTLGNLYLNGGYSVPPNAENAFEWFRKAAYLNNDSAKYVLGEMYANGNGVKKDIPTAVRWYLIAANRGVALARFQLSNYDVLAYVDENDLEYVSYKASLGDVKAQLKVGKYYYKTENPLAAEWLGKAANNDVLEAQKLLADIYAKGKCKIPVNYPLAFEWYKKAAEKNDLESVKMLAYLYSRNLTGESGNYLEKAYQYANLYLKLVSKNQKVYPDPQIYKTLGDIYMKASDYSNALVRYSQFIQQYSDDFNTPLDLIEAIEMRSTCYYELKKYQSAENDAEVALAQLDNYKNHSTIVKDYPFIKGLLLYKKGKAVLKMGNSYKACSIFQQAKVLGVEIEQNIDQVCMN